MISRRLSSDAARLLVDFPAVALLGPRQVGKTTLALTLAERRDAVYLDLESPSDRARLSEPELYLREHADRLVILDEIQRVPELFATLRGIVDRYRRDGRAGRFLLLGSASIELLRQSAESLAGRIAYLELEPLDALEVREDDLERLWLRGGFPDSFLAADGEASHTWRLNFIRTYLERDVPQLGPRIAAETLRRFWTMLAHTQGGLLNAASLARGLGIDGKTVARYLDLMVDLLLVRRLPAWTRNTRKRMVKSPKVFVRDSGVAHTLLGLADRDALLGHPRVGGSWEGFVVENLLAVAPERTEASFYRASGGAEVDLVLALPHGETWAVEIKRSLTPKLSRGFHSACGDIDPARKIVVYPGEESFPLQRDVSVMGLREAMSAVAG